MILVKNPKIDKNPSFASLQGGHYGHMATLEAKCGKTSNAHASGLERSLMDKTNVCMRQIDPKHH